MALSVSPVLFYSDSSLASLSSFCNYCVILPHALERPTTARRDTKRFHTHTHAFIHARPLRAGTRDRQLVFSVDCRSSIRLHSAPGINQNTGNGTKILGGGCTYEFSKHTLWLCGCLDSVGAPQAPGNKVVFSQNGQVSVKACHPAMNPGTKTLTALQPKSEGWDLQFGGRVETYREGHGGFYLHLVIPARSYSLCAHWAERGSGCREQKNSQRQRWMILHNWFIWLSLTWCFISWHWHRLLKGPEFQIHQIDQLKTKFPQSRTQQPFIVASTGDCSFAKYSRKRGRRTKESQRTLVCLRAESKTWAWITLAEGEKSPADEREEVNSVKLTQWRSWSHAVNRILPSNNTRTCFSKIKHALGKEV